MSHDGSTDSVGAEAIDIANAVQSVIFGHNTAAVYCALSMIIGYSATRAERPDLDRLLQIIGRGARDEFDRRMKDR